MTEGPIYYYVLLGDSVSLICGTGLDSNPQPTITWTAPDGTTIVNNVKYNDNGTDILKLNITNITLTDAGEWRCDIVVRSEANIVNRGRLIKQNNVLIGSITVNIQLVIIGKYKVPN